MHSWVLLLEQLRADTAKKLPANANNDFPTLCRERAIRSAIC